MIQPHHARRGFGIGHDGPGDGDVARRSASASERAHSSAEGAAARGRAANGGACPAAGVTLVAGLPHPRAAPRRRSTRTPARVAAAGPVGAKEDAGMKALVTGGAGFIGSWIVDLLLDAGHDVAIVDNLST